MPYFKAEKFVWTDNIGEMALIKRHILILYYFIFFVNLPEENLWFFRIKIPDIKAASRDKVTIGR